jgi:hypothetical protein
LVTAIDIERRKNRLLKFCYVPATSTAHNRLLFFSLLLQTFTVLMKQTRQAVHAIKQSIIFLDVYGNSPNLSHFKSIGSIDLQSENSIAFFDRKFVKKTSPLPASVKGALFLTCSHSVKNCQGSPITLSQNDCL